MRKPMVFLTAAALAFGCCGRGYSYERENLPQETALNAVPVTLSPGRSMAEMDEESGGAILIVSSPSLKIETGGYPALDRAVSAYWDGVWSELETYYRNNLQRIKESRARETREEYILQHDCEVLRSDRQILSFTDHEYRLSGGDGLFTYLKGVNLDPATGRRLTLRDVASDYNGIYEYVRIQLDRTELSDGGFKSYGFYTPELYRLFREDDLEWTMDEKGTTLYFNRGALAFPLSGYREIRVPFEENPLLFKEKYIP